MKKILLTSAGGSAALGFMRSLRKAASDYFFIGCDADKYYLERSEADEKHLIPLASSPHYRNILLEIIEEAKPDMIHTQTDVEVHRLSAMRDDFDRLGIKYFLPDHETIEICLSKFRSYEKWLQAGLTVPATHYLHTPDDLRRAFDQYGSPVWIREDKGAFGKGSLPAESFEEAKLWIDVRKGWGSFTAAEMLDPTSMVTWQSIWHKGVLVVAQTRKRLYWEFGNRAPSGVTGLTGAGVTISDPNVDRIAQQTILAVDPSPHGIFSVDMTYNRVGVPNPTEINIGRFFTTHHFFSEAGLNMPHIFTSIALGGSAPFFEKKINPLPENLVWIRGLDFLPKLSTLEEVEKHEERLQRRLNRIGNTKTP
ncbi:hypothetical protein Despr_0344 [Desulfobulbus propionicus DSM 2032]|uniref:ATP-grasp domain-containing protein n=1 Tax=Desulfobulbus propionicus (strain ATCC 33891 / DSM 2032 / VKM B-1956 / 1pr3) TaxID=577650 RepID=A0A7U4DN07_DESPD|nr:hypothetical protein [Desulfobulbus propionicus]ADW16526.1 hypothetical protein Despr_0344 [Desulfobulbus propionicus DSM 2032]